MLGPDRSPRLTRRRLLCGGLRGALAVGLLGAAGPTLSACGSSEPPAPDPLEEQLRAARADADLAARAAAAAPPAAAPALRVIADERRRHATALVEELSRAAGKPTPSADETGAENGTDSTAAGSAAPTGPAAPPPPPPSIADVGAALRRSAESASALVPTLSGYRAGLLGSIAAACTASATVGLPRTRRPA